MHGLCSCSTLEPLLTTTPDSQPPCLLQTLTMVPTASQFRIVLKKPLFHSHLSSLYYGQLSQSQLYATILNDPDLADTF